MRGSTSPEMDASERVGGSEARAARTAFGSAPRLVARIAYWGPVLVCMVLFAQVSFLGLRPAVCERKRLTEAEAMMDARHAQDLAMHDAVATGLRARNDPIFLERQRRQRLHGPVPARD